MAVNMHHCRYHNTNRALQELTELNDLEVSDLYELSDDEMRSLKSLVKEMDRLTRNFKNYFGGSNISVSVRNMEQEIKEYEDELD